MKLLISQKNQLYKIIEEYPSLFIEKFSISDPSIKDTVPVSVSVEDTEYSFMIFEDPYYVKTFNIQYIPGEHLFQQVESVHEWDGIITHFRQWLTNLNKELKEPNYWDRLKEEMPTVNFTHSTDNSNFSQQEFEELKRRVIIVSQQINTIPLIIEQQNGIIQELERVSELARNFGKIDWLNLFVGTIINIIIQLNITKEIATMLWDLIAYAFNMSFLA